MYIRFYDAQVSLHWWVILVALASPGYVHAQPNAPAKPTTVAQVLALAANPRANVDYQQVHLVLNALAAEERKSMLRQLIVSAHEGLASSATRRSVSAGDADAAGPIASRIYTWNSNTQFRTLQDIAPVRDRFMEIPRELVRNTIKSAKTAEPPDFPPDSVGYAAILLAKTRNPADRQMLLDLAQLRPRSWGVWMAIAYAGAMDLPRARLASPVYTDPKAPIAVRVAAASALEPIDSLAGAFATTQVESFLTRFTDQSLSSLTAGTMQTRPAGDAYHQWGEFKRNFHLLSALLVLKAAAAERLTFQFLNARNMDVRGLCGMVAAMRWPERLLKSGQGSFSDREYAGLMAIVALNHPEQAAAAAAMVPPEQMERAKSDFGRVGLGVAGMPGNLLRVF